MAGRITCFIWTTWLKMNELASPPSKLETHTLKERGNKDLQICKHFGTRWRLQSISVASVPDKVSQN
jgi:hypothetical protein